MHIKDRIEALEVQIDILMERMEALEDALDAEPKEEAKVYCDFEGDCIDCEELQSCLNAECHRAEGECDRCCMKEECDIIWEEQFEEHEEKEEEEKEASDFLDRFALDGCACDFCRSVREKNEIYRGM